MNDLVSFDKHTMLLFTFEVLDSLHSAVVFTWDNGGGYEQLERHHWQTTPTIWPLQSHAYPLPWSKLSLTDELDHTHFESIGYFHHHLDE